MYKYLVYNFVLLFLFNMAHPVTPEMLIVKNSPGYLNGLLMGIMSLGVFLFSPYWGNKFDKKGVKNTLFVGPFFYGIAQIGLGLFSNEFVMAFFRFLSGFFSAGVILAITIVISQMSTNESRGKNLGYIMFTGALGGLFGQQLASIIFSITGSFMAVIYVQAIGCMLMGVFLFFTTNIKVNITSKKTHSLLSTFKLVKKSGLMNIMVCTALFSMSLSLYTTNIGYFLTTEFNADISDVAKINSLNFIVTVLMNLLILSLLLKNFSLSKILKFSFLLSLVSIIIILLTSASVSMIITIIMICLFLSGLSIYRPIIQKYVYESSKKNTGELTGAISSFNSLGMIAGNFLAAGLYTIDPKLPFYAIVLSLLSGVCIYSWGTK